MRMRMLGSTVALIALAIVFMGMEVSDLKPAKGTNATSIIGGSMQDADAGEDQSSAVTIAPMAGRIQSSTFQVPRISNNFEQLRKDHPRVVIIFLQNSGLGSQLVNLLAQKMFFEARGRLVVADDTKYQYRWDHETGVLHGFFKPTFPVVNWEDYSQIEKVFGVEDYNSTNYLPGFTSGAQIRHDTADALLIVRSTQPEARKAFKKRNGKRGVDLYQQFAAEACSNLQFSDHALIEMKRLKALYDVPDLTKSSSVAFHIRRGDKVSERESKLYHGATYVEKLKSITTSSIQDCFVASDDYSVLEEVKLGLAHHSIHCKVHSLVPQAARGGNHSYETSKHDDAILLLTELSMMVDATYFVGTFNSNLGNLASLLRACTRPNSTICYAHSYGVDTDDWFLK